MFYYAKLNQNNICVSVETSAKKLEERNDFLRQQDYVPSLINRKWLGDQWSQETYEDATEIERLKEENEQLKDRILLMEKALEDLILSGGAA